MAKKTNTKKSKNKWYKQKTTWTALALVASVALPACGVSPQVVQATQVALAGLTAIFGRQAINKAN